MEEPQFGRRTGEPKPSISAMTPLCKSYCLCSHKGQVPLPEFPCTLENLKEMPFSRWIGEQRAVNMEPLATNSFLSDEAMRIWKPKTLGTKLPDICFSGKLLLSNASRPKSSKMSPTAATLREEWWLRKRGSAQKAVNMEHRTHVSFLIDKVDTMQKSRLQGPSIFRSVLKGPRFIFQRS